MTLITITTIGYGEIRPLSDAGRIFTSVLIVVGIGTAATGITQIGSLMGRRKMDERVKRRQDTMRSVVSVLLAWPWRRNWTGREWPSSSSIQVMKPS
jgi:voltage-gated potassium channel